MEPIAALAALVVSLLVGRMAMTLGPRYGVVDRPDTDLKPHSGAPVPLGGAGVLVGAHVGLAVAGVFDVGLLAATALIWLLGLVDDIQGLPPLTRLIGAAAAGVLLVSVSDKSFDVVIAVFWVVAVVVLVNAVNLIDGMDGLAGSVAAVAFVGISWFGAVQGAPDAWTILVIAAALLGFLYWNRPSARLFLGDNGAYTIGVFMAWAAMQASPDRGAGITAVALVGVPLIDLGITVVRRLSAGTPLFSGDRDHSYDRLNRGGLSPGPIALLYSGLEAVWVVAIIAIAILFGDLGASIMALLLGAGSAILFGLLSTKQRR